MIVFNMSLASATFPKSMKISKVQPLFKSGVCMLCNNYRPISLLPVLSKILEKIVHQKVVQFLVENNIIAQTQFGFHSNHLTTNAMSKFEGDILNGFEKNYFCLSLFIDLHKAFDCVSHSILLENLKHYGIRDNALNWFKSYLHARTQYVQIDDMLSSRGEVDIGVFQGSVLGPLLFLKNACKYASSLLFTDDTTVYTFGSNPKFMFTKLQYDLNELGNWLASNKLQLSIKKTKYIFFRPKASVLTKDLISHCTIKLLMKLVFSNF